MNYENYEKMIYKNVDYAHRHTGKDKDELFSEANELFCRAKEKFNPKYAVKFSTYLQWRLKKLLYYSPIPEHINLNHVSIPIEDMSIRNIELMDAISILSDNAQSIINLVFNPPSALKDKKLTKHVLFSYIIKNWAWKHTHTKKALQEIKTFVKENIK